MRHTPSRPGPQPGVSRERVLAAARTALLESRPLELGPLAKELGVGRSTVYRWFGDREGLLAEVLAGFVREAADLIREGAEADGAVRVGRERLWHGVSRFVEITERLEGFRALLERDPLVVVRVIMDPRGHVEPALTDVLLGEIRATRPDGDLPEMGDHVLAAVIVQSTMVALYARTIVGEAPDAARSLGVARAVIYGSDGADGEPVGSRPGGLANRQRT